MANDRHNEQLGFEENKNKLLDLIRDIIFFKQSSIP